MELYKQKAVPTEHLNNNNCKNNTHHHELQHISRALRTNYQGLQQKRLYKKVILVLTNELFCRSFRACIL